MGLFKLTSAMFRKRHMLFYIYNLYLAAAIVSAVILRCSHAGLAAVLLVLSCFSVFSFLLFAFLGERFGHTGKNKDLEACIEVENGYTRIMRAKCLFLFTRVCLYAVVMLLCSVLVFSGVAENLPAPIAVLWLYGALSFFFLPLVAMLLGMVLSLFSHKKVGLPVLLLIALLCVALAVYVVCEASGLTGAGTLTGRFGGLLLANGRAALAPSPADLLLCIGGTVFLAAVLYIVFRLRLKRHGDKRSMRERAEAFLKRFFCFISARLPDDKVFVVSDNPRKYVLSDWHYYLERHPRSADQNKEAPFRITAYDLKIKIGLRLQVEAAIQVDKPDLDVYELTLYHGLTVQAAADEQGRPLTFRQDGDYIEVQGTGQVERICLTYRGHASAFYAHPKGICLPGHFPYYPHSGYASVYDRDHQGFARFFLDEPVFFRVAVYSRQNVLCSLTETGQNTFAGVSCGVSILAGVFDTITVDGVRVAYPQAEADLYPEEKVIHFVYMHKGTPAFPESVQTIFIMPESQNLSPYAVYANFGDHLVLQQISRLDDAYREQLIDCKKEPLYAAYQNYLKNPKTFCRCMEEIRGMITKCGPNESLLDYFNKYGEEEGCTRLAAYLKDPTDHTYWQDFMYAQG